jgi:ATP-binding cassette subfamily B multidrug efflux pump
MSNRTRTDRELLSLLLPFMRPQKRAIILALCLTPVGVAAGLVQPILLKHAIDEHLAIGQLEGLNELAALFVGVVAVAFIARAIASYSLQRAGLRIVTDLRNDIFDHVMRQSRRFFDRRASGSLMTRTTNDIDALAESLMFGVVNLLSDGLMIIGVLTAMMMLEPMLTLATLALAPLIVGIVDLCRRRLRGLSLEIRKTLSRLNGFFAEQVNGMSTVQMHGAEATAAAHFGEISEGYLAAYKRSNWWDAGVYAAMDGMAALAIAGMLWFGGSRIGVPESVVTVGLLVAFIDYLGRLFGPIREFSGRIATVQRAVAALQRISELLDEDDTISSGTRPATGLRGQVIFEDVHFRYAEDRVDVLRGVSLSIEQGEVVALVGSTGSGKTTIGRLAGRVYDGYRGSIRIDGHEITDLEPSSLRKQVALVEQDARLMSASVAENISLWSEDISQADVESAAALAHANDFIEGLKHGYDEQVGAQGISFSSGQEQLLAIARAMARPAPIVILDEATASVDPLTEARIDKAISALLRDRTVLVIAHRLSTIRRADRVLVLHRGQVVEQGTHEALREAGGHYSLLVQAGAVK